MKTRSLLMFLLVSGLCLLAWTRWPDAPSAPVEAVAARDLQPPSLLALGGAAPEVVAPAPPVHDGKDCPSVPPLPPHEEALATQRALASLAAAAGGDAVLALLLQRPEAHPASWAAQVRDAALRSGDVAALRWAAGACTELPQAMACRRELLRERLRLEPDNGLHWLALLHEDPGAADEAWAGLAASSRWLERPAAWRERLDRALPPGLQASQRGVLLAQLAQREAEWAPPPPADLDGLCGHWGPGHANGVACRHATVLMLTHSDSPRARQQGKQLAQLTGQDVPQPDAVATSAIKPMRDCVA